MDESVWLTATKPLRMVRVLERLHRRLGRPPCERKLKYLALACARLASPALGNTPIDSAVEAAERNLVGWEDVEFLNRSLQVAQVVEQEVQREYRVRGEANERYGEGYPVALAASIAARVIFRAAAYGWDRGMIAKVRDSLAMSGQIRGPEGVRALGATIAAALRDIFGNPFRPVAFDPGWRTDTVVALASQAYESRDFGAMPILADALQDAGCDNEHILSHCRGPEPHVRGCWVADLALGRLDATRAGGDGC